MRFSEKERALHEARHLFFCCEANPDRGLYEQFVALMSEHNFNEENLEVSVDRLKALERRLQKNRADFLVAKARADEAVHHEVEELMGFFCHGIFSEEELGLRPGEMGVFRSALNRQAPCPL